MDANAKVKEQEHIKDNIDLKEETSRTALGIGIAMAALVGLWGVACLIGGLASSGLGGVIRGYFTAIFGN